MEIQDFMIDIIALVVMTIGPFAGIYMYIKNSNKLMSMAMGAVSKMGSGLVKASNKWATQKQKNSRFSQAWANRESAVNEAAQRRAYKKFQDNPMYTTFMGRDAKQIMAARVSKANDAIEADAINQSIKTLPYYNPTARKEDRGRMAQDAFEALEKGDVIKAQAIASVAARSGADEFKDFHEALQQKSVAAQGGWNSRRVDQMKQLNGRILKDFGSELRPKNLALTSALERSFNDLDENGNPVGSISITEEMASTGMGQYYKAMGAQQVSVFSTDTATAAAGNLNDRTVRDVIENETIRSSMKEGTRKAYEAEYTKRFGMPAATKDSSSVKFKVEERDASGATISRAATFAEVEESIPKTGTDLNFSALGDKDVWDSREFAIKARASGEGAAQRVIDAAEADLKRRGFLPPT